MTFRHALVLTVGAVVVLALAGAVGLAGLAEVPFYTRGEPREAVVVQEMWRGGGLILPLRNGDDVPAKPPVFHWLGLAASQALGRVDVLSTRLPSVVLGVLAVLGVYLTGACVGRIRSGWLASIALLFSFEWLRAMRTARVDMTLTFFITAALLVFLLVHHRGATWPRLVLLWLCLALATLAKGPIGLLLPVLIVVVYALALPVAGDGRGIARRIETLRAIVGGLEPLRGLAAVVVLTGGWYLAAWAIHGSDFLIEHVLKENVLRVFAADALDSGHRHGVGYMIGALGLGTLPFALLAPAVVWWLFRQRPLDSTRRFLVVWFVVVVMVFLLPQSKRGVYLLPAYPAGALLFGLTFGPGPEDVGPRRLAWFGFSVLSILCALLGVVALLLASGFPFDKLLAGVLRPRDFAGVQAVSSALSTQPWLTAGAGVVAIVAAWLGKREARGAHWLRASVPLTVMLLALLGGVVAPAERAIARQRTMAEFANKVRRSVGDGPLAFLSPTFDWGLIFYLDRNVARHGRGVETASPHVLIRADETAAGSAGMRVVLRSGDEADAMLLTEPLPAPVSDAVPDANPFATGSPR